MRQNTRKTFIPGSEWLYFKIYTGTKTADALLAGEIRKMADSLLKEEVIDKFFFIRYTDPDFHLRVRFRLKDGTKGFDRIFNVVNASLAPLIENRSITSLQCDTYVRELERYGPDSIDEAETIFHIDSICMVGLLDCFDRLPAQQKENDRWKTALILCDDILDSFGMDLEAKSEFITAQAEGYKREFGLVHKSYTKQLNDKYRSLKEDVEKTMKGGGLPEEITQICEKRASALKESVSMLPGECLVSTDPEAKRRFIASILHMSVNRLFRNRNRLSELVICDMLSRYYKSELAKAKYSKKEKN